MMKKLLTMLFAVALGLNLSAQVPESVVDEGLVGWWPFESNYDDYSGNENNCSVNGSVPFVQDRSGVLSSARFLFRQWQQFFAGALQPRIVYLFRRHFNFCLGKFERR